MNALFDIIIVGAVLFCAAAGYRRGLVKTVMSVLSFAIAFFTARAFAPNLSDFLYTRYIKPNFVSAAARRIERFLTPNINIDALANNADPPENFVDMLRNYGFDLSDVQSWLRGAGPEARTEHVAANLAEPVAMQFSYFLAFILIFAAALILLKIAVNIIDSLVKLPGLNFINKVGGLIAGFVYGIAFCFILVFLASYALPYLESTGAVSSWAEIKDDTIFFRWFYENSPIRNILGLF